MQKKLFISLVVAFVLAGSFFWLHFMNNKQNTVSTKAVSTEVTESPSVCGADKIQEFKGKYYSFRYPCQYTIHVNSSDDRIVSFGSSDYLARLEKDGGLITNPQGYMIIVSYDEIKPSIRDTNKSNQELWLEWMGRGMGSIGKSEFLGMTKDENGKEIFKSVVKGYGFMDEMKEKQVHVRIGLHSENYTKSAEMEILTPEKDLKQNESILSNVVRTFSFK